MSKEEEGLIDNQCDTPQNVRVHTERQRVCHRRKALLLLGGTFAVIAFVMLAIASNTRHTLPVESTTDYFITEVSVGKGKIPGSNHWMTCGKHMSKCGHYCCCHIGYEYHSNDRRCHHPINDFNNLLDDGLFDAHRGLYYAFSTAEGQVVSSGKVQSTMKGWTDAKESFPLASASKLFTAFAAMVTMELKPKLFYPNKKINNFKGWENFKQFPVHGAPKKADGSPKKADLTIHQLLTHTSGLPFAMRVSKKDIQKMTLFFWPGTKFGYTLGHRVIGWLLRDFWKEQPEGKKAKIKTVQDTYKYLIFDRLGLSKETKFDKTFQHEFGTSDDAGDAALASTGEDLMKLAVVALNKGKLPNGKQIISVQNWNNWAVKNKLPHGKLTKDLVDWQGGAASWADWNVAGLKGSIMKQSGDYGWSYFGATYFDSKEIGWCGFFSSCLRVSYPQSLAFVMMQRDVVDLKKSKPHVVNNFDTMAKSLQCQSKKCGKKKHGSAVFCQTCGSTCKTSPRTNSCPSSTKRYSSILTTDRSLDPGKYSCYVPSCHR